MDETGTVERLSRHLTLESEATVVGEVEAMVSCVLTEGLPCLLRMGWS